MNATELRNRFDTCRERIEAARARAGRSEEVAVVAVTKTYPVALLHTLREIGVRDVGENRVAELEAKSADVGRDTLEWHLIGHLQRNKAARAVPLFDLLHSLDSPRLAEVLSKQGLSQGTPIRTLVQVNTSGEASKTGLAADGALDTIARFCELPGLRVEGLMTMAPFTDDAPTLRRVFRAARALWEEAARQIPRFHPLSLSMGMSNDYEIAVEEGSTLVRLGTALFGKRNQ